jgi:hypothetical protein
MVTLGGPRDRVELFQPLAIAVDFLVNGDGWDLSLDQFANEGFHSHDVWVEVIPSNYNIARVEDGLINWRMIGGYWPEPSDCFLVAASFISRRLVVPRDIFLKIVTTLRTLRADVLEGRRLGRTNNAPVPPLAPLTPDLAEYERLRLESMNDAVAFRQKLYARRG